MFIGSRSAKSWSCCQSLLSSSSAPRASRISRTSRRAFSAIQFVVRGHHMNLRRRKALTSAEVSSNHSPFFRRSANLWCQ